MQKQIKDFQLKKKYRKKKFFQKKKPISFKKLNLKLRNFKKKKIYKIKNNKKYKIKNNKKYKIKNNKKLNLKKFKIKRCFSNKRRIRSIKKLLNFCFKKRIEIALSLKKLISKKIVIRISQNNIFCSFIDTKRKKTLHVGSSGIYKVEISKRKLKNNHKLFLEIFFKKIQKYSKTLNNSIIKLIAPKKLKKKICFLIKKQIKNLKKKNLTFKKKYNILINIINKKCFNGCKSSKRIRKKRKYNRIFK
jgi:hypothetical protein